MPEAGTLHAAGTDRNVRRAGIGALYEKFAQLKARLDAAGWFAESRKRPLPAYPRRIGIVTEGLSAPLRALVPPHVDAVHQHRQAPHAGEPHVGTEGEVGVPAAQIDQPPRLLGRRVGQGARGERIVQC